MIEELTITLRKPITLGDISYTEIKLQEPTAGQLEKASKGADSNVGMVINLISTVAVVPRKVAESLCQRDLKEASNFLESFEDLTTG